MEPDGVESAGAPQVEKTPKAWALQDEFLETARKLVERVCSRLGVEPPPSLGLIAFPSWKEDEHPPILVRAQGLKWAPTLADWKDEIVAAEKEFDESTSLARWVTGASSRTLAFRKVAAARIEEHDKHGETRTFVTQATSVWSYDVAAVLEFEEKVLRRFPNAAPARLWWNPAWRTVAVGHSVATFPAVATGCRPLTRRRHGKRSHRFPAEGAPFLFAARRRCDAVPRQAPEAQRGRPPPRRQYRHRPPHGRLDPHPGTGPRRHPPLPPRQGRKLPDAPSDEDVTKLLANAKGRLHVSIALSVHAGLRMGEGRPARGAVGT